MTLRTMERTGPVPVTISRRPLTDGPWLAALAPRTGTDAPPTPPVAIEPPPIGEDEIRIITDMDGEIFSAAGCSCSAGDDQPY
ncbi:hypothetical protein ACIRU8_14385 [Streptomyces sp. NPDC101175]|uniref:hypothetical protein n=1 Tax=Streptomyces sp. NPDC101175 TaxID=3366123 RepID=UPI00383574E0